MQNSWAWLLAVLGSSAVVGCSDASSSGGSCRPNEAGAGLQSGAPWATYRGDARHSGAGVAAGPAQPVVAWIFAPVGSNFTGYWPPAVAADGTLYVVADLDMAYAVTGDGKLKWTLENLGRSHGSPTIGGDGTIYFSMRGLSAVSPQGTVMWTFTPTYDDVSGTAAIGSDGTIYIAADSVGLYALGAGGCVRWVFAGNAAVGTKTSPAIGMDGTIYFGIDDAIVAVDPDGKEQWRYTLGDIEHLSPVIGADGTIYAVTGQAVTALSPDGKEKWTLPGATTSTQFPPSLSADGQLYVPNFWGLRAFDASGIELWSVATQSVTAPTIDANGVAYTSEGSCVASAIAKDGTVLWSQALTGNDGAGCGGPVMGADGTMYFTSTSAGVIAVKGQ